MRDGQPERLGDDLRRRRRAEELAAAARRRTGTAAEVGGLLEGDKAVREARPERLDGARILTAPRRQRHAARDDGTRERAERRDRHRDRGQPFVTCSDTDHASSVGEAAHEAAQNERRIIAVGQRVEHPRRALAATVARV